MNDTATLELKNRLCSEIQLFDLCDLDACRFKKGRFCTNVDLKEQFEKISEEDDFGSSALYVEHENDDEDDFNEVWPVFDDADDSNIGDDEECRYRDEEE